MNCSCRFSWAWLFYSQMVAKAVIVILCEKLSAYVIDCAAAILCPHHIAIVADITVQCRVKGKASSEWICKNKGGNPGTRNIKKEGWSYDKFMFLVVSVPPSIRTFFLNVFTCIKAQWILYTLIFKHNRKLI